MNSIEREKRIPTTSILKIDRA